MILSRIRRFFRNAKLLLGSEISKNTVLSETVSNVHIDTVSLVVASSDSRRNSCRGSCQPRGSGWELGKARPVARAVAVVRSVGGKYHQRPLLQLRCCNTEGMYAGDKECPSNSTSSEEERVSAREDDDEYCDIPTRVKGTGKIKDKRGKCGHQGLNSLPGPVTPLFMIYNHNPRKKKVIKITLIV